MSLKKPVSKQEIWCNALFLISLIIGFPSLMIYLEVNGHDPSEMFSLLVGFAIMGMFAIAFFGILATLFPPLIFPFVLIAYPFIRIYQWLTRERNGEGKNGNDKNSEDNV